MKRWHIAFLILMPTAMTAFLWAIGKEVYPLWFYAFFWFICHGLAWIPVSVYRERDQRRALFANRKIIATYPGETHHVEWNGRSWDVWVPVEKETS